MNISEFGMRISELKEKLKSFFSFFNLQSAFRIPHSFRYFSLGQQKVLFLLALFILVIVYLQVYDHSPLVLQGMTQES